MSVKVFRHESLSENDKRWQEMGLSPARTNIIGRNGKLYVSYYTEGGGIAYRVSELNSEVYLPGDREDRFWPGLIWIGAAIFVGAAIMTLFRFLVS